MEVIIIIAPERYLFRDADIPPSPLSPSYRSARFCYSWSLRTVSERTRRVYHWQEVAARQLAQLAIDLKRMWTPLFCQCYGALSAPRVPSVIAVSPASRSQHPWRVNRTRVEMRCLRWTLVLLLGQEAVKLDPDSDQELESLFSFPGLFFWSFESWKIAMMKRGSCDSFRVVGSRYHLVDDCGFDRNHCFPHILAFERNGFHRWVQR